MSIGFADLLVAYRPPQPFLKVGTTMEAAGVYHSLLYANGRPGPGVAPTPGIAGAALTTYGGQIPFQNPGPTESTKLARFSGASTGLGTLEIWDRLWHNSGIIINQTTPQTINSVPWPARDRSGSTLGEAVQVGIEVSAATGNGSVITNTTMSYTNDAGVSGRTAIIPSFPATAVVGTFVPFTLQAGDTGVRSIQTLTPGTSYVSGTYHLVAYRTLMGLGISQVNVEVVADALSGGFPTLHDDTVPWLVWLASATAAVTVSGRVIYAQR
jgi:hypothetical protein